MVGEYCDDCGELGCAGGDNCGEVQACCVDTDGKSKHKIARYMSNGVHYRMCERCGDLMGDDLDQEALNEISCCVVNGVVNHRYPTIKYKGSRYHRRCCMVCGQTKNLFRSKSGCIVCTSGDDSHLGFKCSNLKKCRVEGRRTIVGGAYL